MNVNKLEIRRKSRCRESVFVKVKRKTDRELEV